MLFQLELYESQFNDVAIRNTDCPITAFIAPVVVFGQKVAVVVVVVVVVW